MSGMYIRQTRTASKASGESYITYRLVRGERIGGRVRQITLLNLGRHFDVAQDSWVDLCARIEQIIGGQAPLLDATLSPRLERIAQGYAARLIEQAPVPEKLWRTYSMLTDLEAVFRSLKSELGLRAVYHRKEDRIDSHPFITVLAYQLVQVLRRQLGAMQNHQSWNSLRATLSVQRRVTATFRQKDGRTLNIRKSTRAEPELADIYSALNINPSPGGVKKLVT